MEEEAREDLETGIAGEGGGEDGGEDAFVEEQELGFDAADIGGGFERFEDVAGEGGDDGEGRGLVARGVDVADDGFVAFVDAEGEADDAAAVERDEAGKDARIQILEQELGGGFVVPVEALVPEFGLLFEERTKLLRGEVAQVEDLELLRGRHESCRMPVPDASARCQQTGGLVRLQKLDEECRAGGAFASANDGRGVGLPPITWGWF